MRLVVTIDVEEDQWGIVPHGQATAQNVYRLPRLQALLNEFGIIPTYLVTYPVMQDSYAVGIQEPGFRFVETEGDLGAGGADVSASAELFGDGVDVDGAGDRFAAEADLGELFAGLGLHAELGGVGLGEHGGDHDGFERLGVIGEAAGIGGLRAGGCEVGFCDGHDRDAILVEELERIEGAAEELEAWEALALLDVDVEGGVIDSGGEEFGGDAEDRGCHVAVLEPAGVGREAEVERLGDFSGQIGE